MQLISKQHEVDGFRFDGVDIKPPKWFRKALEINRIQLRIDPPKDKYEIHIYTDKNSFEKALLGDWVCQNSSGKIFKITHAERIEAYE
jgi:hypothetical protein